MRPRTRLLLLFVSGLTILPQGGWAADLSLEECLTLARGQAPALQASEAEVSRLDQAVLEARSAQHPSLKLGASYLQYSEAPRTIIPLPGGPNPVVIKTGNANLLGLRTDGQFTLYSSGRNRALIQAAEAARDGQRRGRELAEADMVLRVSQAFYRAEASVRLEAAAREAVTAAESHLGTSRARVRAGMSTRVDSLRATVDLAQRSAAYLRARESTRQARIDLETAIGAPLDPDRFLASPGPPAAFVPDLESEVQRALSSRPELAIYDQSLRATGSQIAAARAGRLPQVNLNATAEYFGPNQKEEYLNLTEAGLKTYKLYAGLAVSMPLLDGGLTRARLGQLEAQRRGLLDRRRDSELAIRREVGRALSDLRVTLAVWPSDRTRVIAAEEALRLAEAGYQGGTSTATDVRDAEAALADARAAETSTLMDYWMARASLDHATGAPAMKEN
jgi:outer membrane protein TolC